MFAANLAKDREKWVMVLIETADRYGKLKGIVLDSLWFWDLFKGNSALHTMIVELEKRLQRIEPAGALKASLQVGQRERFQGN
ncbi:MAG: hypothetical protein H7176_13675 [Bdellovibrionales bacterium]|nr:hypothetical protein [Massilia sp.]